MKKKFTKSLLVGLGCILFLLCAACVWYVNDYYRADQTAISAFSTGFDISPQVLTETTTVYTPEQPTAGLIFYPGGKVEPEAYEPLMLACAQEGILCVLVEMPFHLAVLDMDAAQGIPEQFPEVEHWYLGGHSLGGSMACAYLEEHSETYEGVILLGSYSTADLSASGLEVLSVWGSEDGVLNRANYEKNRPNLPADFTEVVLEGGCHAYFGMYGPQEGDGSPTISNEEQLLLTTQAISKLILS